MIDLSHLTEEEQGAIMTVLRRDAELKKAEEERISKLEKLLNSGTKTDSKWKYLTGEWFYEAKSQRHMDKIHGSEIILASMKQKKVGLEGSLRIDRSKASSGRTSDIIAPPKPARCLEAPQAASDAEKENLNSGVRSPRTPRHNPFNRASLIVVEPHENNNDVSTIRDQESSDAEPLSPLKTLSAGEAGRTSGGSITSEGSSTGFRPVPKKRTFLSRRTPSQTDSSSLASEAQPGSAVIVPAPRRSLQRGSSESSNQSCSQSQNEVPQKNVVSDQAPQSAQSPKSLDETSQLPRNDVSKVSTNSSLEIERNLPSLPGHDSVDASSGDSHPNALNKLSHPSPVSHTFQNQRPATNTRSDATTDREMQQKSSEREDEEQGERSALNAVISHITTVQGLDRDEREGSATRQYEEPSLPQSIVDADAPVSYDLKFIDTPDQQSQTKPNPKHVFKLTTQTSSPAGDEDSIAKVLDWFNRSTDNIDWLSSEAGPETAKSSDRHEVARFNDTTEVRVERKKQAPEMKRSRSQNQVNEAKEFRAMDRTGDKELSKIQDVEAKNVRGQDFEKINDESQPTQVSHLKSFWEKSNMGPKILIGKSASQIEQEQKPTPLSTGKDQEKVTKVQRGSDAPVGSGVHNEKGSNGQERGASPQKDTRDHVHEEGYNLVRNTSTQRNSDNLKLAVSPQVSDRRGSTSESSESGSVSLVKPNPQPDNYSQSRETTLRDNLSKTSALPQPDVDLQTWDSPDDEKLSLSRNSPYMDYKLGASEIQITPKTQIRNSNRGPNEDTKRWDTEDNKNIQSTMSPKRKEDLPNRDKVNSPNSNRKDLPPLEVTAERIKQLKSFWEQERNKPTLYASRPKALADSKRGANQAKLNKRFTKSEYDLTSIGNCSGTDEEDFDRNHQNLDFLPLNQREKSSPGRAQFKTLREFWDEASSDAKGSFAANIPKSPKKKEPLGAQLPSQELKGGEPEIFREKSKPVIRSSPPTPNRSKPAHDRQSRGASDSKNSQASYLAAEQQREFKRSSSREDKSMKQQSSPGRDLRSQKGRKDSFSNSSSRGNSMRRATSMFSLSVPDEKDQGQLKMDASPAHSQSRKQRLNTDKGTSPRRSPAEPDATLTQSPRARACVPRDYRHYLGMTDATSVHNSLAPTVKDEGSEGKSGHEFELSGLMRSSTPVSSDDWHSRKSSKSSLRPLWTSYSSSDGHESSLSSTSESWSNARNNSNREVVDDSPVRKALRRAEARPKNLAKSMEDITASLSPRQDPTADMRRISDVSTIPSPSSSLFSDPDHLKMMSKSVPSFLQKELSGSVMTMYSGDFGNVEVQGNIQFSINYIQKIREFHIFVAECRDLAAVDPKRGRSDPYVKSYLVPDKANLGKRKTSVKKKTLNPTFNEILRYRVRMEYLRTQTLILSVWHHDTFGKNSFLGEVDIDLSKWDFDHTQMNSLALKARTTISPAPSNDRGEMRLAIRFLPQINHSRGLPLETASTGEIHIWVKECKNLPLIRATIDPYVKCFVLPDTSRKSRQKTRVLRRTADPVFNHTMVYDGIREADLADACVELTVWDRDRLASNLLGGLRLGLGTGRSYGSVADWMDSTPYEVALWERMKASPNEWVEDVLPLRMLNSSKSAFK
ncbi:uncharacterized protein V6R79_022718 [Siganus canaliculatus]